MIQEFRQQDRPKGYRHKMARRMCHRNSLITAIKHPELAYVEGFALAVNGPNEGIWIPHAWNADSSNNVIDRTWITYPVNRFIGMRIPTDIAAKIMTESVGEPLIYTPEHFPNNIHDACCRKWGFVLAGIHNCNRYKRGKPSGLLTESKVREFLRIIEICEGDKIG